MASTFGPYRGVVDHVHDGDTVNVKLDVGFDLTVYARARIVGINAPELTTAAGKAARDFAQQLLPAGSPVEVVSYGWDKYGGRIDADVRMVEGVYLDREFGDVMIEAGHAVDYDGGAR